MDATLTSYVTSRLQQGLSEAEIRRGLLATGWTEQQLADGGFAAASVAKKSNAKTWLAVMIGIMVLLIGGLGYGRLTKYWVNQDDQRKSDLSRLTTALGAYYALNKQYPSSLGGLVPNYTLKLTTDPGTGLPYASTVSATEYKVCALLHSGNEYCASASLGGVANITNS